MARAAIELSGDISPAMPLISKVVEGCSYSPEAHLIAFNLKGMSVIIEPNQITVYGMKDEAEARNIIDWLKQILDNKDKSLIENERKKHRGGIKNE